MARRKWQAEWGHAQFRRDSDVTAAASALALVTSAHGTSTTRGRHETRCRLGHKRWRSFEVYDLGGKTRRNFKMLGDMTCRSVAMTCPSLPRHFIPSLEIYDVLVLEVPMTAEQRLQHYTTEQTVDVADPAVQEETIAPTKEYLAGQREGQHIWIFDVWFLNLYIKKEETNQENAKWRKQEMTKNENDEKIKMTKTHEKKNEKKQRHETTSQKQNHEKRKKNQDPLNAKRSARPLKALVHAGEMWARGPQTLGVLAEEVLDDTVEKGERRRAHAAKIHVREDWRNASARKLGGILDPHEWHERLNMTSQSTLSARLVDALAFPTNDRVMIVPSVEQELENKMLKWSFCNGRSTQKDMYNETLATRIAPDLCEYCRQYTLHVTFSLCTMRVLHDVLHNTSAQVSARALHFICIVIHVMRLSVVRSLTLCSSPSSFPCVSPISSSSSTWTLSWTSSSMWSSSGQDTTGTPTEESGPLAEKHPSHRLWAQHPWRLPLLKDYWNLLPAATQRHGALLVRCGTPRRDHRQSALFTTVHSGARRTSGPTTSLSLFWRKFVASSVFFSVSCKNGETRAWT